MTDREKASELAQQIVRYETQEKGFFGKLFGFEARDGGWSKAAKALATSSLGYQFGALGLAAMTILGAGLPVAIVGGIGSAILGGIVGRSVEKKIISDMHDGKETSFENSGIGFYLGLPLGLPHR